MMGIFVLLLYSLAGLVCARVVLWDKPPLIRAWLGLSFGVLLLMWLPALAAFLVDFTMTAEYIALGALAAIVLAALLWQRKHPHTPKGLDEADRPMLIALACFALPLTILSAYLQHTHTLQEIDGALYVGQSTYGDLCLHLSITTGLRGASFPPEYIILPGTRLGYPFLTDAMSTTLYMFGMPLRWSLIVPGTLMSGLVYGGFLLLAREMTGKTSAAVIAGVLLFLGGGLGFLYDFDLSGNDYSKIAEIFSGFYMTPANQPDINQRWSNLIADMLLPQRTFLGGWTLLLPALYLAREAFQKAEKRMFLLVALFGAALPLVHTHSFVALALYSAGALVYMLFSNKEQRRRLLAYSGIYLGIVLALALPQLIAFTFPQSSGEGFIRFHFNWVNYSSSGFKDFYPWFWLKNVGLPLIVMLFALLDFKKRNRMDAIGAALIFIVAETILFQPNEYDNNKLFYVWYLLMLPMAADWCVSLWEKLRDHQRSRVLLAALFITGSTLSGALSIARETISSYQIFAEAEVKAAEYIEDNTDAGAVFLTGTHHNNPVYALAGRKVVCGPGGLYLYWHGLDYSEREADIKMFYASPAENLDILEKYGVTYIVVSNAERYNYHPDENVLSSLFEIVYSKDGVTLYAVGS